MNATDTTPRVWIGALGAYNAGRLVGEWCDATNLDELNECAERVLAEARKVVGPLEAGDEIMLADREGFGDLIGEYTPLERVAELGALIDERGPAFVGYAGNVGAEYADAEGFEESYCGEYESEKDYAYDYADSTGAPTSDTWPTSHVAWDSATRELMESHYSIDSGSGVYMFRNI
jgi:antirestriction protein